MSESSVNGVVDHTHTNRKTDYLFRVSMKALVINERSEVLVVKETGRSWWDLPGGGMDHDEDIKAAIARELKEEVNLIGEFTYRVIAVEDPAFLEHASMWQIRLIFAVTPKDMTFVAGEDGDEVMFIIPEELRESDHPTERKVYEYSLLS